MLILMPNGIGVPSGMRARPWATSAITTTVWSEDAAGPLAKAVVARTNVARSRAPFRTIDIARLLQLRLDIVGRERWERLLLLSSAGFPAARPSGITGPGRALPGCAAIYGRGELDGRGIFIQDAESLARANDTRAG